VAGVSVALYRVYNVFIQYSIIGVCADDVIRTSQPTVVWQRD